MYSFSLSVRFKKNTFSKWNTSKQQKKFFDVDEPLAKRSRMLNEEDVVPINMAFDKITKNPGTRTATYFR